MDEKRLQNLSDQLLYIQARKQVGLLSSEELRSFVEIIEKMRSYFARWGCTIAGTYAGSATETEYDNHSYNTPVGYCPPYTAVIFEEGDYRIERVEGRTEFYEASRKHPEGMRTEVICRCPVQVWFEDLLLENSRLPLWLVSLQDDGSLRLVFWKKAGEIIRNNQAK